MASYKITYNMAFEMDATIAARPSILRYALLGMPRL